MINQIMIAVTGILVVFLSQSPMERHRKWACIYGMIGQPFWFYVTYQAEQWGMFALAFVYTLGWIIGIKTYWIKPNVK